MTRVCDRKRDKPGKDEVRMLLAWKVRDTEKESLRFSFLPFSSRPTPQARTGADLHFRTHQIQSQNQTGDSLEFN